jgi:serine carboxypeptidase-like clade 2
VSDQLNAEIPNAIDPYDVTAKVCLSFGASLLGVQNNPFTPRFRLFSSAESLQEALSQQVSSLRDNNSSQDITFFSLDLLLDFSSPYAESSREH